MLLLLRHLPAQVFPSADVTVDVSTDQRERLSLQLEVVKPAGSKTAVLTARNLSRVVRGRRSAATVCVNGQPLLPPHGAAAEISPGDVLEFGSTGLGFQVLQQQQQGQQFAAVAAVRQYCGVYAQQRLGLQLPVQEAVQQLLQAPAAPLPRQQQQQQGLPPLKLAPVIEQQLLDPMQLLQQQQEQESRLQQQQDKAAAAAAAAAAATAAADALELQLRNISRLVRSDPRSAEQQLATLAAENPTAAGPWFLWAQLAAGRKRVWMARELYRAAAECQQQQMLLLGAAEAAAGVTRVLAQQQRQQELLIAESSMMSMSEEDSTGRGSPQQQQQQQQQQQAARSTSPAVADGSSSTSGSSGGSTGTNAAFRLTSRLIQILRSWGKLEWDQKLFGPARRLWRLAANEAFKFPYEISAGGGGSVLHCWATAEFERDNILNARVIIGEALRKCPRDAAVSMMRYGRLCCTLPLLLFQLLGKMLHVDTFTTHQWHCLPGLYWLKP
mgnify:CR=1 FL=1